MRMSPDTEESIRCSSSGCSCVCFKPGGGKLRSCDRCGHGWVSHALEKLQARPSPGPVEVALPGLVFDLSSLVLYGAQAVPVRLKILLDRLYSVLTPEQVGHILHTLGWTLGDYVRGYMLQYPGGKVLDRWAMVTPEEELQVLRQFLRFGETRPIVELMTLQGLALPSPAPPPPNPAPKRTLGLKACPVAGVCRLERGGAVHHFEKLPGGMSQLLPSLLPGPAPRGVVPPTKDLAPPTSLTQNLQRPGGTRSTGTLRIKEDPDRPNPAAQSPWQPNPKQERASSLSPSFTSSFLPVSSCSPPRVYQRLRGSSPSPSSFHPLPSFSSSFLCPLPASSSFSSPLHALPPSPCSLPSSSPAGGRKGRVCCGVCGKSFYDKGTLKIHYNAVHLKIKHRCTVSGCSMVFSSLRSRNRHSANPNPRLHTATACHSNPHHGNRHDSPPPAPRGRGFPGSELQVPPRPASPLLPAPPSPPSLTPLGRPPPGQATPLPGHAPLPTCTEAGQHRGWGSAEPTPKKKPRKSSMPVKIERERLEGRRRRRGEEGEEEEEEVEEEC